MAKRPQTTDADAGSASQGAPGSSAAATNGQTGDAGSSLEQRETALQDREKSLEARERDLGEREDAFDRETEERENADRERAAREAEAQRDNLAAGGTGAVNTDTAERHTIADPKAAPVDYSRETLRRPAHRTLAVDEMDDSAMPRAPIPVLPYGSEPRSINTDTGLPHAAVTGTDPASPQREDAEVVQGRGQG